MQKRLFIALIIIWLTCNIAITLERERAIDNGESEDDPSAQLERIAEILAELFMSDELEYNFLLSSPGQYLEATQQGLEINQDTNKDGYIDEKIVARNMLTTSLVHPEDWVISSEAEAAAMFRQLLSRAINEGIANTGNTLGLDLDLINSGSPTALTPHCEQQWARTLIDILSTGTYFLAGLEFQTKIRCQETGYEPVYFVIQHSSPARYKMLGAHPSPTPLRIEVTREDGTPIAEIEYQSILDANNGALPPELSTALISMWNSLYTMDFERMGMTPEDAQLVRDLVALISLPHREDVDLLDPFEMRPKRIS